MSSYAEMARERRRARSLYFDLPARGWKLWVEEEPDEPLCCRIVVGGLRSLSPAHADRVVRRIRSNEAGLVRIILAGPWTPDLEAIRREGNCR